MSIHGNIKEDIKTAMRAKDQLTLTTLRGLSASFTNELINKKSNEPEISDEEAITIIKRTVKQRKDSIEQFTAGGRPELAENEKAELVILEKYLPQTMSKDEIRKVIESKIAEMGGSVDKTKAGMFMGSIMKELKGKADGSLVKEVIDELVK
jgi:uncharacterized protein YqeY